MNRAHQRRAKGTQIGDVAILQYRTLFLQQNMQTPTTPTEHCLASRNNSAPTQCNNNGTVPSSSGAKVLRTLRRDCYLTQLRDHDQVKRRRKSVRIVANHAALFHKLRNTRYAHVVLLRHVILRYHGGGPPGVRQPLPLPLVPSYAFPSPRSLRPFLPTTRYWLSCICRL